MQAQMVVLQLPLRLSLSRRVTLLSLNGMWLKLPSWLMLLSELCASIAMQLPSAAIDLLIFLASYSLIDSEPVLLRRSDPAKSTIVSKAFL